MAAVICGVDVSSSELQARIGYQGATSCFDYTPDGIEELIGFVQQHGTQLVVMEATGGYEKRALALLWAHGVPVAIVNPRSVRDFAKGMGILEKTDEIDAGVIAWYAEVKRVAACPPAPATQQRLEALVTRLRQLTQLQVAQRNQCRLVSEDTVSTMFTQLLAFVKSQIRELETAIAQMIATDPVWQKLDKSFRSIKGVAGRTVSRLMADMPEIGTLSNKAIAKLAGVAPLAQDSGKKQGKRAVRGGRRTVRDVLFIVAGVVRLYDPDFMAFHQRLSAAGKPKKVIRIALAHKLLVRLNAKAREVRQSEPQLPLAG